MPLNIKGLCRELFRLLVIAALVFMAIGTGSATTSSAPPPPPPPPTAIGGTVYPISKAQVLAPWLGLFLVMSLAMGRIIFSLRKKGVVPLFAGAHFP